MTEPMSDERLEFARRLAQMCDDEEKPRMYNELVREVDRLREQEGCLRFDMETYRQQRDAERTEVARLRERLEVEMGDTDKLRHEHAEMLVFIKQNIKGNSIHSTFCNNPPLGCCGGCPHKEAVALITRVEATQKGGD